MSVGNKSEQNEKPPAIECRGLTKEFRGNVAVDAMDLTLSTGSITALLGPNGAGKTTTLRMLLGLLRPTSGSARLLGCDSAKLGPAEFRRIGYVAEGRHLPLDLAVKGLID